MSQYQMNAGDTPAMLDQYQNAPPGAPGFPLPTLNSLHLRTPYAKGQNRRTGGVAGCVKRQ